MTTPSRFAQLQARQKLAGLTEILGADPRDVVDDLEAAADCAEKRHKGPTAARLDGYWRRLEAAVREVERDRADLDAWLAAYRRRLEAAMIEWKAEAGPTRSDAAIMVRSSAEELLADLRAYVTAWRRERKTR